MPDKNVCPWLSVEKGFIVVHIPVRQVAEYYLERGTLMEGEPELPLLTHRQRQVFEKIVIGKANKEIAQELGITERTVKFHASAILKALGKGSRKELLSVYGTENAQEFKNRYVQV